MSLMARVQMEYAAVPPDAWLALAALLSGLLTSIILMPARRHNARTILRRHTTAWHRKLDSGALSHKAKKMPILSATMKQKWDSQLDIGLILTEVAMLLRSGATSQQAWARTLHRHGLSSEISPDDGLIPDALKSLAQRSPPSWLPSYDGQWHWQPPILYRGSRRAIIAGARSAAQAAITACRLSAALGAPLAEILDAVALDVSDAGRAYAARLTALAGPRSTARLLAALPVVGLALGASIGAHPGRLLLDGSWGSGLALMGASFMVAGHILTRRMIRAAERNHEDLEATLLLQLARAALEAGASIPGVLHALADAKEEESLHAVAHALMLGADWEEAWQTPHESPDWERIMAPLRRGLQPGWDDGASPAPLLAAHCARLRAQRVSHDEEVAEKLAVSLVVPLGLCHLPAFLLLGIVPVIVSVGADIFH